MSGEAWKKSRRLLAKSYCDLGLVSITGAADEEMSFSADTDVDDARRWHRHADPVPRRVEEHATTRGRGRGLRDGGRLARPALAAPSASLSCEPQSVPRTS